MAQYCNILGPYLQWVKTQPNSVIVQPLYTELHPPDNQQPSHSSPYTAQEVLSAPVAHLPAHKQVLGELYQPLSMCRENFARGKLRQQ